MTKNILHYNYNATVREIYDLTKEESLALILHEQIQAKSKNHAVILTSKGEEKSAFDAYTQEKLTRNFTWIHFCPQNVLNFDDETPQEEKYYVFIMENIEAR